MPHGSQRKKKLILSSDYFLAFTPGRFETAPQVCPMLYMHVLVRKCPFNGCIREVLSSYKTSLFYLSKFAIRRLAPLFQVKSDEGDFTARKQQKWTTCKECHHNTKFPSRYMVIRKFLFFICFSHRNYKCFCPTFLPGWCFD